jgi:hypothetical protein
MIGGFSWHPVIDVFGFSLIKLGLVILFVLVFRERGNGWVSTVWDVAGGIFHGVTS